MELGLGGRVAIVTAASKGLGRASALALADEGAAVAICARGEAALRQTEWAKTAASDLFGEGITVNLACPGYHATDRMKQLGTSSDAPMGNPADFGRVVAFLCSEPAGFVSGTALQIDGAHTSGLL